MLNACMTNYMESDLATVVQLAAKYRHLRTHHGCHGEECMATVRDIKDSIQIYMTDVWTVDAHVKAMETCSALVISSKSYQEIVSGASATSLGEDKEETSNLKAIAQSYKKTLHFLHHFTNVNDSWRSLVVNAAIKSRNTTTKSIRINRDMRRTFTLCGGCGRRGHSWGEVNVYGMMRCPLAASLRSTVAPILPRKPFSSLSAQTRESQGRHSYLIGRRSPGAPSYRNKTSTGAMRKAQSKRRGTPEGLKEALRESFNARIRPQRSRRDSLLRPFTAPSDVIIINGEVHKRFDHQDRTQSVERHRVLINKKVWSRPHTSQGQHGNDYEAAQNMRMQCDQLELWQFRDIALRRAKAHYVMAEQIDPI